MEQASFLVMDDEDLVHQAIDRVVERRRLGVRLVRAQRASEADAMLAECTPYAGLLLDVYVPDGNGFEVLGRARSLPAHVSTPALLMTGAPDVSMFNRAFDLDAEVITKPVDEFDRLARFFTGAAARRSAPADNRATEPQLPDTLEGCVDRLRELGARYPDARTRYRIGAVVAALKAQPEIYGSNAVGSASLVDIPA